jgi:hypothetical protein
MTLDSKIPAGPIEQKWDNHRFAMKLVYDIQAGVSPFLVR